MPEPLQQHFFTPAEVAALMRHTVHTVRRWVKDGRLEAFKPAGSRRLLIPAAAVQRLLEGCAK